MFLVGFYSLISQDSQNNGESVLLRKEEGDMSEKKTKMKICAKWREIITGKIALKILSVSSEFLFDRYVRVGE